LGGVKTGKI